jgi:8-oxo-dGTP pyrophosphatase MutT (NUDIX family)
MREAAGYIVAFDRGDAPRFLVLRNARHGTWGFPKGHLERGESPDEGARRELEEETGIRDITPVPGFAHEHRYMVPTKDGGTARKRVVLYLARVATPAFTLSHEHDEGGFLPAEEARERLAFEDLRDALDAAVAMLDTR